MLLTQSFSKQNGHQRGQKSAKEEKICDKYKTVFINNQMRAHVLLKTQLRVLVCENDSFFHPTIHGMEAKPGESIGVGLPGRLYNKYHG